MSGFISNITFGRSKAQAEVALLDTLWALPTAPPEHCCSCDPYACSPALKRGECGCAG